MLPTSPPSSPAVMQEFRFDELKIVKKLGQGSFAQVRAGPRNKRGSGATACRMVSAFCSMVHALAS